MKKSRYSEEQVIGALKQMESGRKARELARGLEVSEAGRLRDLEQENARLKKLVADLSLDKDALQTGSEKMYGPPLDCKQKVR